MHGLICGFVFFFHSNDFALDLGSITRASIKTTYGAAGFFGLATQEFVIRRHCFFFFICLQRHSYFWSFCSRFLYNVLSLDLAGSFAGRGWHAQNGWDLGWVCFAFLEGFSLFDDTIRFDFDFIGRPSSCSWQLGLRC